MIKLIHRVSGISAHGNMYAYARTLLALGSLSTLIFNNLSEFFPLLGNQFASENFQNPLNYTWIDDMSIFNLFSGQLYLARIISISILVLVAIGWRPRLTGVLHWWVSMSIFISIHVPDGGDQLTAVITLLLIPVCLTDAKKWHWTFAKNENTNRYLNLTLYSFFIIIKLQICLLYLQAAIDKFSVKEWKDGSVLYYWFTHYIFGLNDSFKPIIIPFLQNPHIITLLTWSVLALELLLFASFFATQKFRNRIFYFAIIFHFMIFIIHGLFSFFVAMIGALVLYLFPPNFEFTFLHEKRSFLNKNLLYRLIFSENKKSSLD